MKKINISHKAVILSIKDGDGLSLDEIHKLKSNNCSVLRSAHVGNLDAQTLFLANEGFSIMLDEYARGSMRVYRPAYKIENGSEKLLGNKENLPISHLYFSSNADYGNNCIGTYHYNNLISLFPNSIKLTSSHLLKQEACIYEALKILLQKRPQSFARLIEKDGTIFHFKKCEDENIFFYSDLGEERIFKMCNFPEIVIKGLHYTEQLFNGEQVEYSPIVTFDVDTDVSLITLCDIDWRNLSSKERITAIHFSGLEMINYMVKNKNLASQHLIAMNEIFNLLIHIWTDEFSKEIEILIVPTDSIRCFVCDTQEKLQILNESFSANKDIHELNEKKRILWKKHQKDTSEYIMSLTYEELVLLIKNIEPNNAPEAFAKTLFKTQKLLDQGNIIERKLLNQIAFNHLLYKNMKDIGITDLECKIDEKRVVMEKAKIVSPAALTQYDLLKGDNIYFPILARSLSSNELRNFNRRIQKNDGGNK